MAPGKLRACGPRLDKTCQGIYYHEVHFSSNKSAMLKIFRGLSQSKATSLSKASEVISSYRVTRLKEESEGLPPESTDVAFVHHRTTVFNLGDYLSSPRHYFKFTPTLSKRPVVVVGGGVFGNFQRLREGTAAIDIDSRVKVAWGVGISNKNEGADSSKLFEVGRSFDFITTRDADNASEAMPFCPCASVMNAIAEMPVGTKTGILLNFDPRASGADPLEMLSTFDKKLVVGTNAVSESDFRTLFGRTSHIVTNSYHTAYWGLMSGRSVAIVGFSSKYESIKAMYGLDYDIYRYKKGDGEGLRQAIATALSEGRFVKLDNGPDYREKFRDLNKQYAARLVEAGIFARIEPVVDDGETLSRRNGEVFRDYILRQW